MNRWRPRSTALPLIFGVALMALAPVPAAANTVVVQDNFGRSITNGWGEATSGGSYALSGRPADFWVNGTVGVMHLPSPGATRAAGLVGVAARDIELGFATKSNKLAAGGHIYVMAAARRVSDTAAYWVKLRFGTDRRVYLQASRLVAGKEQRLATEVPVPDLTHSAGGLVRVRAQVSGVYPTTIRIRAWAASGHEPDSWQFIASDSTAALQVPGALDLRAYLGGRATNAPVRVRFDDLRAVSLSTEAPAPPASEAILVGAGDIADCNRTQHQATAKLLDGVAGTVFAAGDLVVDGLASQFENCYGSSWGRHKARTEPAPGNREYRVSGATPYFDYWGSSAGPRGKGWYAFDLGAWRVYVLNSNCGQVGCGSGSEQERWLRAQLAANPRQCVAAIMHHPRFTSSYGADGSVRALWQALYDYRSDLVISGHAHNYERFALQDPAGKAAPGRGIRLFVVGTGGHSLYGFETNAPNSQVRNASTHGVLKLTLETSGYDWQFLPITGRTFTDSGSASCV